MKQIVYFIGIAISFVLIHCGKSDSDSAPSPICLLSTGKLEVNGTTKSYTFQFNVDGSLHSTNPVGTGNPTQYTYDSQGQLIKLFTEGEQSSTFYYNGANQRIRDSSYLWFPGGETWTITQYIYNGSGQMIHSSLHTATYEVESDFTYPNTTTHNYSKTIHVAPWGTSTVMTEYDDHSIPLALKQADNSLFYLDNFIKKETYNHGPDEYTNTITYDFNSKGLPTKIHFESSNPIGLTYTQTYTYTCD